MVKFISNEKGTLLVEALAMLGLIGMVTPTLYKKSAERLFEIQDINAATQARTMNSAMASYLNKYKGTIIQILADSGERTIEIGKEDRDLEGTTFRVYGYGSSLPYGYNPDQIKNFQAPKVYVHMDSSFLTAFVVYNKDVDLGKQRHTRLASLVGANGGLIAYKGTDMTAKGTGGAWSLNKEDLASIVGSDTFSEDSLVVTSEDPVSVKYDDNDEYVYRKPDVDDITGWKNSMQADLYMGRVLDSTGVDTYSKYSHSIFNIRKLTLNTDCNKRVFSGDSTGVSHCDVNVADLYVGKPTADDTVYPMYDGRLIRNDGSAWFYGNFTALGESFKLSHSDYSSGADRNGYDILEFGQASQGGNVDTAQVIYATNELSKPEVGFIDGFAKIVKDGAGKVFTVGGDSSAADSSLGGLILAHEGEGMNEVTISGYQDALTQINPNGGTVKIGGGSTEVHIAYDGEEFVNVGSEGEWMHVTGKGSAAVMNLLSSSASDGVFTVGNATTYSSSVNRIYADSTGVSLQGGAIQILKGKQYPEGAENGGFFGNGDKFVRDSLTEIASRDVDIYGNTYIGKEDVAAIGGVTYSRDKYNLAVAGSAWVDETLIARRAWLDSTGTGEFHAGHDSVSSWVNTPGAAPLNVYTDKIIMRNPSATSGTGGVTVTGVPLLSDETMFYADSSLAVIGDGKGGEAWFQDGKAVLGSYSTTTDYFYAGPRTGEGATGTELAGVAQDLLRLETANTEGELHFQDDVLRIYSSGAGSWVEAKTGTFTVNTKPTAIDKNESAQVYVDNAIARVKGLEVNVQKDSSDANVFIVRPDVNFNDANANVEVDGGLYVHGNDVIHIANHTDNVVTDTDYSSHAMLEIAPNYMQVRQQGSSAAISAYKAMFKVNASDTDGTSTSSLAVADNASVYVRKGAIELEKSTGTGKAADEGYGYIKANRLVSNTDMVAPHKAATNGNEPPSSQGAYDQYMVNPAYTSVMHDIKLTSRGGARLSDILPDYILKGVYNVSNDHDEGGDPIGAGSVTTWASPIVGNIPIPSCPNGYSRLATIMPVSFAMGQAGRLVRPSEVLNQHTSAPYVVDTAAGQGGTQGAFTKLVGNPSSIVYPSYIDSKDMFAQAILTDHSTFVSSVVDQRTAGWYFGVDAIINSSGADSMVHESDFLKNRDTGQFVAEPLYFQQNTWLKTSVIPEGGTHWVGRMGFIYDTNKWFTGGLGNAGIVSNNTDGSEGSGPALTGGNFVWNLFPVPTNTLEGQATVYCYFRRSNFTDFGDLVDQNYVETINGWNPSDWDPSAKTNASRLHDPSLKYDDPW